MEEDRLLIEQLKQGALPPDAPPGTAVAAEMAPRAVAAAAAAAAAAQEPRRAMQPEGLLESFGASLFSNLARAGHGAVGGADSARALNDTPAVLLSRGAARGGRTLEGDERGGPISFVTSDAVLAGGARPQWSDAVLAGGARPQWPAGWSPALADPLLSRPAAAAPELEPFAKAEAAVRAPQPPQPQPPSNATPAQVRPSSRTDRTLRCLLRGRLPRGARRCRLCAGAPPLTGHGGEARSSRGTWLRG